MKIEITQLVNEGKVYQIGERHIMTDEDGQRFIDNGWGVDVDGVVTAENITSPDDVSVDLSIDNSITGVEDSNDA